MSRQSRLNLFGLLVVTCSLVIGLLTYSSLAVAAKPKKDKKEGDKPTPLAINEIKHDGAVNFEKEILPILTRNCIACHHGKDAENHFIIETPQTILKGGDAGPAVVPKQGANSLLLKAAAHQAEPTMPPDDNDVKAHNLSADELGLLKLWIDQGATGTVSGSTIPLKWQTLPPSVNPIYAVAVSADGQFAACGRANQIFLYHLPSGRQIGQLADPSLAKNGNPATGPLAHLDLVQSLAFSPMGDLLASGGFREVKLWRHPRNIHKLDLTAGDIVRCVTASADGKWAALGDAKGDIQLIDLAAGKVTKTLSGHTAAVTGLRFSADGAKLYSCSLDKTLRAWNTADGAAAGQITSPQPINSLALTSAALPDNPAQIVTGEADTTVRVWPLPVLPAPAVAPVPLKELKGHTGAVIAVETLPSGKEVVTGSEDGTVRHWNVETGAAVKQMANGSPVFALAVRADGKRIASSGAAGVKLWNGETGAAVADLKGDFRAKNAVAKLERAVADAKNKIADAKKALTEAQDRAKKETEAVPKAEEAKTAAAKVLADKTEAAKKPAEAKTAAEKEVADADAELKTATAKSTEAKTAADKDAQNKDLAKAAEEAKKVTTAAEQKLAAAKNKLQAALKPAETAAMELKNAEVAMQAAVRGVEAAQLSAKKATDAVPVATTAVTTAEETSKQTDAALEVSKKAATDLEKPLRALAFSPNGQQLASGGEDRLVHTWQAETGAPIESFEGQGEAITAVCFLGDGKLLSGAANKSAIVWDADPAWTLERTIGDANDPTRLIDRVIALDFSPDGKLLATGSGEPSRSGELKFWNVADGNLVRTIPDAHSDTIFCVRFSPDGAFVATSAADRFVKTFNVATGAFYRAFEGHTHHVLGVAWKSDGKTLASGSADNTIKVWDFVTGDQKKTIDGFGKEVTSVNFLADSDRILSSCGDKSARVNNAVNGSAEKTFNGPGDFIYCSAATPDGKTVVAGGQDSVLRVWNAESGQPTFTFDPTAKPAAEAPKK